MLARMLFGTNFCLTAGALVVSLAAVGCGLGGGEGGVQEPPERDSAAESQPSEAVTEAVGEESPASIPEPSPKPEEPEGSEPTEEPELVEYPSEALSSSCQELLDTIVSVDREIPTHFMVLERPVDEIDADMRRVVELSRRFLKECDYPLSAGRVKSALARSLLSRHRRFHQELLSQKLPAVEIREKMKAYFLDAARIAEEAVAVCPENTLARILALRTLMDGHLDLGSYDPAHYDLTRQVGARLMKEFPAYPWRTYVFASVAQSYQREGDYEECVKYMQGVLDKYSEDPDYVIYNIRLFEALTGAGDLEGMEELMQLIRVEYPQRIEDDRLSSVLRNQYNQWYHCQALFWLGFIRMAQGDMAAAEKLFSQHIAEVDSREAELAARGESIDNVCPIIRDFRSKHLIEFIQTVYGKKPEVDFEDLVWITEEKLTLKESIGKVVVIVFRRPEDARAATFLQAMDRLVKERREDGLVGLTMGFFSGRPNPETDAAKMEAWHKDLESLGVTLPAGLDPDRKRQNIMRSLFATVGTASCAVINRKGEVAWWMADCRDLDKRIAARVIDRLLAEE